MSGGDHLCKKGLDPLMGRGIVTTRSAGDHLEGRAAVDEQKAQGGRSGVGHLACRAPSLCIRRVVWSCLARIIYILGRTQSEFKSLLFPQPPPSLLAGDAPPPGVPHSLPTSISPIPQHPTFVPPMVCIQCLLFYIIANALVFLTV